MISIFAGTGVGWTGHRLQHQTKHHLGKCDTILWLFKRIGKIGVSYLQSGIYMYFIL